MCHLISFSFPVSWNPDRSHCCVIVLYPEQYIIYFIWYKLCFHKQLLILLKQLKYSSQHSYLKPIQTLTNISLYNCLLVFRFYMSTPLLKELTCSSLSTFFLEKDTIFVFSTENLTLSHPNYSVYSIFP